MNEICNRHALSYSVIERKFETREDVIAWIVDNQWTALYEVSGERNHLVPCPFRIVRHPSIRISEKEILSAEDERRWNEENA